MLIGEDLEGTLPSLMNGAVTTVGWAEHRARLDVVFPVPQSFADVCKTDGNLGWRLALNAMCTRWMSGRTAPVCGTCQMPQ